MTTHSSILTWRTPWTEEPGGYSPWGHNEPDTTEALLLVSVARIHLDGWGSKCVPTWGTRFMVGWCPSEDEKEPTEKFPPTRPGAGEGLDRCPPPRVPTWTSPWPSSYSPWPDPGPASSSAPHSCPPACSRTRGNSFHPGPENVGTRCWGMGGQDGPSGSRQSDYKQFTVLTSVFQEKVPMGGFPDGIPGPEASKQEHRDKQGSAKCTPHSPPRVRGSCAGAQAHLATDS